MIQKIVVFGHLEGVRGAYKNRLPVQGKQTVHDSSSSLGIQEFNYNKISKTKTALVVMQRRVPFPVPRSGKCERARDLYVDMT